MQLENRGLAPCFFVNNHWKRFSRWSNPDEFPSELQGDIFSLQQKEIFVGCRQELKERNGKMENETKDNGVNRRFSVAIDIADYIADRNISNSTRPGGASLG